VPRLRPLLATLLALTVAVVCVRLGVWQLGRWREVTARNERLAAQLAAPPLPLAAGPAGSRTSAMGGGRVWVEGRFDEEHQFVLVGRAHQGSPGVHLVTPLLPGDGGPAILVDRGFVPAPDAATAWPPAFPESVERRVVGLLEPLARRAGEPLWREQPNDSIRLWSARWIDPDSVAAALPYRVAPVLLVELPGPGVPAEPRRVPARPADTTIHLNYAGQWFFFALVSILGPILFRRARRRRAASGGPP
jgi:surfeit locus 1 family protein